MLFRLCDLYLLGVFDRFGRFGDRNGQNAIFDNGLYLVGINGEGQRHHPLERPRDAFDAVVLAALFIAAFVLF